MVNFNSLNNYVYFVVIYLLCSFTVNVDCNFNELKRLTLEHELIPFELMKCYLENNVQEYSDFVGKDIVTVQDITIIDLTSTKKDTLVEYILIFNRGILIDDFIIPTEVLVNHETNVKFAEVNWDIKNEKCIYLYKYYFKPINFDTLKVEFSILGTTSLQVDTLKFCN